MDYSSIKAHFKTKEEHKDTCKAICPAHADKQASLSISYDSVEKKTLVKCHAGCETIDVMAAVGLKVTDLFDLELIKKDNHNNNIEAVYKYHDIDGNVLFEKVRFKGKKFSQRRYEGESVIWGLDGGTFYETFEGSNNWSTKQRENVKTREFNAIEPVIYNLPNVMKAVEDGQPIFIVEGEKDADNLIKLGIIATTSFDGASKGKQKWRKDYNKYFKDANVVLIPDNDKPGMAHMEYIAKELQDIAKSIKLLELNDLEEKQDVSDWLEKGHDKEELLELVTITPNWTSVNLMDYNFTDKGNADRIIAVYKDNIKYNHTEGNWYLWDGSRYKKDTVGEMAEKVKNVASLFQIQAKRRDIELENEKMTNYKSALKLEDVKFIDKALQSARTVKNIRIQSKEFDQDRELLNCKNGILNINTREFIQHDKKYLMSTITNCDYIPDANCDNFLNSLEWIFPNEDTRKEVQKAYGYSLGGGMDHQCIFILNGKGENGKSTIMDALKDVLGEYYSSLSARSLEPRENGIASSDMAKLVSSRLVVVSEPSQGQKLDDGQLKTLAVGEEINARFMRQDEFTYKPTFKLWIPTNVLPSIVNTDHGFWRRLMIFPCKHKPVKKIESFYERFIKPSELPGILNWALEGRRLLKEEGFRPTEEMEEAIFEYKKKINPVEDFIAKCCEKDKNEKVITSGLLCAFNVFALSEGYSEMKIRTFRERLLDMGYEVRTSGGNKSYTFGLKVKDVLDFRNIDEYQKSSDKYEREINKSKLHVINNEQLGF